MRFVLDTNTCIYALELRRGVIERLRDWSPDDFGVSIVTVAELWFGARKGARPEATRRDVGAAEAYAETHLELERSRRPTGERDLLIASTARARGLTVVTHDVSEFGRVPGLRTEDRL